MYFIQTSRHLVLASGKICVDADNSIMHCLTQTKAELLRIHGETISLGLNLILEETLYSTEAL